MIFRLPKPIGAPDAPPDRPMLRTRSIPRWFHGILVGLLVAPIAFGITLLFGWSGTGIDSVVWWFAGIASFAAFYIGLCAGSPRTLRILLVWPVVVGFAVLVGYIWMETGEWRIGRRHGARIRSPMVAVMGALWIVGFGAFATLVAWSARKFSRWNTVLAVVSAVMAVTGLIAGIAVNLSR